MAEQQQSPGEEAGTEGKPSKGGGKTFLITIVAVVLVAVGAGAAAAYLFFPQVTALLSKTEQTAEELAVAEAALPTEYGEFMALKGFMVNPAAGGRRTLLVDIGLEGPSEEVLEAVSAKEILIRDRILGKLSKLGIEELSDIAVRDSIKIDLLHEINSVLNPEEDQQLSRLYFTAFILN
ncbi:MAG: flagellar basal body-associated protein FliL [Rhodothermales bacterium]|jgi:flagellar basal body-associated protein FliL